MSGPRRRVQLGHGLVERPEQQRVAPGDRVGAEAAVGGRQPLDQLLGRQRSGRRAAVRASPGTSRSRTDSFRCFSQVT